MRHSQTERQPLIRSVVFAGLSMILLAGCGGQTDTDSGGDSNTDTGGESAAADDYPTTDINVIVPFPPGGGADTAIRTLQPNLEDTLGQEFTILNKAGGGGTVGAAQAAAAEPDGYTWVLVTVGPATTQPHLQDVPYTPDSFAPVTLVNNQPLLVVVPEGSDLQSIDDLTAAAKSGDLTWAAPPVGGIPHLTGELILEQIGGSANFVPFDGVGPAVTALLGSNVDVATIPVSSVIQHVTAGKLRALGVSSAERLESLPDVPTLKEKGVDVEVSNWNGVALPAGTPDAVVDKVYNAVKTAIATDKYQTLLTQSGVGVTPIPPDEFAAKWRADFELFGGLIETLKSQGAL